MSYNVSTSEVATYLTCKRRWMYAHHPSYNLEPRTLGVALTRGIVGHEMLEKYYNLITHGESHEDAKQTIQSDMMRRTMYEMNTNSDGDKAKMLGQLGNVLSEYLESHTWLFEKYNIVGVENVVMASLPGLDGVNIAGRVDLTLEVPSGPDKGEIIPWDHKFCYNKWPEAALRMNAQISNYVWMLREMGYRSRKGIINMVRYRDDAREKFIQEEVPTNANMREEFILNHATAAKEIAKLKSQPKVGLKEGITRSTSKFNCEYCPFEKLCNLELRGLDSTNMVKAKFRKNSYGYDSELDIA